MFFLELLKGALKTNIRKSKHGVEGYYPPIPRDENGTRKSRRPEAQPTIIAVRLTPGPLPPSPRSPPPPPLPPPPPHRGPAPPDPASQLRLSVFSASPCPLPPRSPSARHSPLPCCFPIRLLTLPCCCLACCSLATAELSKCGSRLYGCMLSTERWLLLLNVAFFLC